MMIVKPVLIISSLLAIVVALPFRIRFIPRVFNSLIFWSLSCLISALIIYVQFYTRTVNETVLKAGFEWDGSVELEFKNNGKCLIKKYGSMDGQVAYSSYIYIKPNKIVVDEDLSLGSAKLKDTLFIMNGDLKFYLEDEWKGITEGEMRISKNTLK
jgi:hypothetical protein